MYIKTFSSAYFPFYRFIETNDLSGFQFSIFCSLVSSVEEEFTEEEEKGLAKYNMFRKVHQVPLMTLDRKMCDEAKAHAEKLSQMGTLEHSSSKELDGQGENLSMGCSSDSAQTMEEAVTNW